MYAYNLHIIHCHTPVCMLWSSHCFIDSLIESITKHCITLYYIVLHCVHYCSWLSESCLELCAVSAVSYRVSVVIACSTTSCKFLQTVEIKTWLSQTSYSKLHNENFTKSVAANHCALCKHWHIKLVQIHLATCVGLSFLFPFSHSLQGCTYNRGHTVCPRFG